MIAVMKIREAQTFSDEVVDLLVQERIRQNISRYRLAKECGITEAALSYIERHERRPTLYTLKMIADTLNIQLADNQKACRVDAKLQNIFKKRTPGTPAIRAQYTLYNRLCSNNTQQPKDQPAMPQ